MVRDWQENGWWITLVAIMLLTSLLVPAVASAQEPYAGWEEVGSGSASGGGISNTSGDSVYSSMAISPSGQVCVAWMDDSSVGPLYWEVYVRCWNGTSWEQMNDSATGGGISKSELLESVSPSVTVDGGGTLYVAWSEGNLQTYGPTPHSIYILQWDGDKWEETNPGSATGGGISGCGEDCADYSWHPSIAATPGGTIYAAWANSSDCYNIAGMWRCEPSEIYVKRFDGETWAQLGGSASGGGISNNGGDSRAPSLVIAPNGEPCVFWSDDTSGNYEIYGRCWNGGSWAQLGGSASGGGISNNEGDSSAVSAAAAPDGTLYTVWEDYNSEEDLDNIYARRFNAVTQQWEAMSPGSFSGVDISGDGVSSSPSAAAAPDSTLYVSWSDNGNIYALRWNGVRWVEVGSGSACGGGISGGSGFSESPFVAVTPNGTPYVTWMEWIPGENENLEIYVRRYTGGGWDTTPPDKITDLLVEAGEVAGEAVLKWTAPGDDGSDCRVARSYDIRYSTEPITDTNSSWDSANQFANELIPLWPSTEEAITVTNLLLNNRWYFAIKTADEGDNWSELSDVPSLIDLGFRPKPDGYKFKNFSDYVPTDFTKADMREMFGDGVCQSYSQGNCVLKPSAKKWVTKSVPHLLKRGTCVGMSVTASHFFKGLGDPQSKFQSGATTTYALEKDNVRRHISYYHAMQVTDPMFICNNSASFSQTPSDVLAKLEKMMASSDPSILYVDLFTPKGAKGHALTPYAIEWGLDDIHEVVVYDNNHPGSARRVRIDAANDKWVYDMGGESGVWQGDATSRSLRTLGVYLYNQKPYGFHNIKYLVSWSIGSGHLLITNSQGQQIGYAADQFVDEIPDAFGQVLRGNLPEAVEPVYSVPVTDTYTILLDGQTITSTGTAEVVQFGDGYAVTVNVGDVDVNTRDNIVISSDGKQVSVNPNHAVTGGSIEMAVDGDSEGYQLTVQPSGVGPNETISLTNDDVKKWLVFSNADASVSSYNLSIERISADGECQFSHSVNIAPGDTHHIDYGAWNCGDTMTVYVDHGSDGSIDETITIGGAEGEIYLPIILK